MHIHPLLLFSLGLIGAFIGRLLFGRWFNHVSLYSLIWGSGLALFEIGWIRYYPLTFEVWLMVSYAWFAFVIGSAIPLIARAAIGLSERQSVSHFSAPVAMREKRVISAALFTLTVLSLVAVAQHWFALIGRFGSISGVIINANIIYSLRTSAQLPPMIPYLDALGLSACYLGGLYSAGEGRIKFVALLPLVGVVLEAIAVAGRAKILIAAILFFSSYFLSKQSLFRQNSRIFHASRIRRFLVAGLAFGILAVGAEIVRSTRGTFENLYSSTNRRNMVTEFVPSSIYLYASSHPGTFNAYWKAGCEQPFPGSNSFAPLFRILAKLQIADYVSEYTKFYSTPIPSNTGTYLRDLHADFGLLGVILGPPVLGFVCTMSWHHIKMRYSLSSMAVLCHLYVIVGFSYVVQSTRLGYWLVSLISSLVVSYIIDNTRSYAALSREPSS